jgi:histidinol-phosphate phosphatase family protein
MSTRFVLLDRDGTVNVERDHLRDPADVELIPGAAAAIRSIRDDLGMGVVVVTNQADVGRGRLDPATLRLINQRLETLLAEQGASLDAIFVCPHAPEDGCDCRKPAPGLAFMAAERFGFDVSDAFVVGDHASDVQMGRAVGATTIHVRTGHGSENAQEALGSSDHVAADLAEAAAIIAALVAGRNGSIDEEGARARAIAYLEETEAVIARARAACAGEIVAAARMIVGSLGAGHTLLICGNGGSAADAQHLATELVSTLTLDNPRPAIPALALTTDTSLLTAIANDYGVEGIFARQVEAHGRPGDVLLAISTSGSSANVIAAAETARDSGVGVIALSGETGGKLAGLADVAILVPSEVTAHIQEAHIAIEQLIALLVEDALHPRPRAATEPDAGLS